MRKNIFEMLRESFDFHQEIKRIDEIFTTNLFSKGYHNYSPEELIDTFIFQNWKQRNRCINTDDMKETLGIDDIVNDCDPELDDVITYLEYIENILSLSWDYMNNADDMKYYTDYNVMRENIDTLLDNINHQAYYFDDDEMVLVCEKNAQATAVAEIVEQSTAIKVIRYNHYLLKGDIQAKKDIIIALAAKIEPKRKQLEKIDNKLASNLFYMLNNMNLRHNNTDKSSKNYKAVVAKMKSNTLEKWYDETYQLELLGLLLLDNVKRNNKIDELKAKVEGQTNA